MEANKLFTRWLTAFKGATLGSDSQHIDKYTYASPPQNFHYDYVCSTGVYMYWMFSDAAAYEVQTSTDAGNTFTHNRAVFVPWQHVPLRSNSNYIVKLGAINGDNEVTPDIFSDTVTFTTPPLDPVLIGVAVSSDTILWTWDASSFADTGISSYKIYYSTGYEKGDIPDSDTGTVKQEIADISVSSWTERYYDAHGTNYANSQHARWIKAVGLMESTGRKVINKYTYAVAPDTCSARDPHWFHVGPTSFDLVTATASATWYIVERSTSGDFSTSMASSTVSDMTSGLTPNTKYDFRVWAVNGDNEPTPINALNPKALSDAYRFITRPEPPDHTCSAYTDTAIKWSWSSGTYVNEKYIAGYWIGLASHTADFGDFWIDVAYISTTTQGSYIEDYFMTNSTFTRGVGLAQYDPDWASHGYDPKWYYESFGSEGYGTTCATFATPPNDVAFDTITAHSIGLWWKEPEVHATQYRVERSPVPGEKGPWVFISSVTGNHFNNAGLTAMTTYSYRIGAVNRDGILTTGLSSLTDGNRRDYSFVRTTATVHVAPALYAVALSSQSIKWWWSDSVSGVSSYSLYTATDGIVTSGLAASTTYWTEVVSSTANARVTRRVRSQAADGFGDYSETAASTLANPPDNVSVSSASMHSLTVSWSPDGSAGYRLARSQDMAAWTVLKSWADIFSSSTYRDTGLQYFTTYYYAVSGYNDDGVVSPSSSVWSAGMRTSDLDRGLFPVYSTAAYAQTYTLPMPSFGAVSLSVPAGVLPAGYLYISTDAAAHPLSEQRSLLDAAYSKLGNDRIVGGEVVEMHYYDAYGNERTGNFSSPVRLTFTYNDANDDGQIDGVSPGVYVSTLKVYGLDTSAPAWSAMRASALDSVRRSVYLDLQHFSYYALGSGLSVAATLSDMRVYPNPYRPGSGGAFDRSSFGDGVVFDPLPSRARIRIFDAAGALVSDLDASDGTGRCVWNARNSSGSKVASGVYFYVVTDLAGGDRRTGKLVVIR